ncbi:MAG: acyl-CoA dehydrogenase family protein [Patulibacter sp.]|nr:acyl-CoA dehydrogenase family protein [Patulibacter sp.]
MNIEPTSRSLELQERLSAFMDERVHPAEAVHAEQLRDSGDPHRHAPIMEELKAEARERGLWNLFHPHADAHPSVLGLSNVEYAPLAEILGRSRLAPEATNCNAPDSGNMETLSMFATDEQKERFLEPLLTGETRSAFAMTEPAVASSDATNVEMRIERDGDEYLINGRKWWTTGALHPNLDVFIVMGKTDPHADRHRQQSMVLVPADTPGVRVLRNLPVFGYEHTEGHGEVLFENVRVPVSNILGEQGGGFAIAQARLGPGRIHHAMRTIGLAERALELLCRRATERVAFGKPLAARANVQDWIANARIEIEMIRLLTMKAAWLMDTVGNKQAKTEIAAIKVAAPAVAQRIVDNAIQVHGAAGFSDDFPLAEMYAHVRTMRMVDGPDEVHRMQLARQELAPYRAARP